MDNRTAALPSADAFFAFLNGLRRDGYRIDARHIAAAQCLLAGARAEGADSPAARRIKFRLAPLIAKSASEQQDFYRRFDNWQRDLALLRRPPGNTPATGPAIEATKHDQRRWVIAGALTVFLAFSGSVTWYFWPPQEKTVVIEPPPPAAPPERGGDLWSAAGAVCSDPEASLLTIRCRQDCCCQCPPASSCRVASVAWAPTAVAIVA